ncbi:MAG: SH3 domain-containing protein [Verrucomicrobiota bacterium]|jgi:uncharacterized protein YgiM (DUF1202 family)
MKKQIWSVFVATISTSLFAQTNAPELTPPPATPPPAVTAPATTAVAPAPVVTNAPAKKKIVPHKKRTLAAAKEAVVAEPPVALVPGPAEVGVNNVNVRGQASLKGEVIAHLLKGDAVTVLEQINLRKHRANEPAQWAKIAYPTNAHAWVNAKYIDATSKTVLPKKLNLRAGPGENYSVVGLIERGTPVSEILNKGNWMEIEPPTNAYAFVAAMYLKQEVLAAAPANAAPPMETGPAPTPMPVAEAQPIATEPANPPVPPVTTETNAAPAVAMETNAPAAPVEQTPPSPPPPRVVTHEGFVRPVTSVIEPTAYELYDPSTDIAIDYLYTTTTNLDLSRYNGLHIIVTGEEGLAARWNETPVLTIQRILVVSTDTNAVPRFQSVSPRTGHHN